MTLDQAEVDAANRSFWDTLCGTSLAQMLGVTDFSLASLEKFDSFYLGYYPYLLKHVRPDLLWGKRILEVGLGYGTLSQLLAAAGDYTGLDIAEGPVQVVNQRLRMIGLPGKAVQGSVLEPDLEPESFDAVVTIGCLHHTGNLPLALDRVRGLLKPGGRLTFMVYNAYSYRRWLQFARPTFRFLLSDYLGFRQPPKASLQERAAYDAGAEDGAAPETEFYSVHQLRRLLRGFREISIVRENGVPESALRSWTREEVLRRVSPLFGLDLYITASKH